MINRIMENTKIHNEHMYFSKNDITPYEYWETKFFNDSKSLSPDFNKSILKVVNYYLKYNPVIRKYCEVTNPFKSVTFEELLNDLYKDGVSGYLKSGLDGVTMFKLISKSYRLPDEALEELNSITLCVWREPHLADLVDYIKEKETGLNMTALCIPLQYYLIGKLCGLCKCNYIDYVPGTLKKFISDKLEDLFKGESVYKILES